MHPFIRIHSHLFLESPSPIFLICAFAQTAGDTTFLSLLWPLRQTVCCIIWKSVDWISFLLLLCVQASPSYLHGLVWKWRIGDSYYVRRRHRFPTHHEEKRRSVVSPPPPPNNHAVKWRSRRFISAALSRLLVVASLCVMSRVTERERPDWDASVEKCDTTRV